MSSTTTRASSHADADLKHTEHASASHPPPPPPPPLTDDPSDYFDAAADAFLEHHLASAAHLLFRIVYHTAAVALGLRIAKWYFDHTRALADQRFAYLVLSAVGAIPFVLAVPLYGLVTSYAVRRGAALLSRSVVGLKPARPLSSHHTQAFPPSQPTQPSYPSQAASSSQPLPPPRRPRDLTLPLLAAVALLATLLLWQSPPPPALTTPNPLLPPFGLVPARHFDPTTLRYELHADVHATVQLHLADVRRELVAQSQAHAKALAELQAQLKRTQDELEALQNRSVAQSLQHAVDACSVAKIADLAAAAVKWVKLL
ncbi:hypothetical protein CC85DRAFT_299241 [Cutaneotrichosporon oleaginosum]|uniref:Uncharacterized protein n=1 Tax=Cutaneotrichosporon oleaginosum TaxID=879819 RepID=A0A0J0XX01_9TREE|nr:uncharacterized protein CC85DRAFT_299241 [Cutaneotrichosporon oleaginosum]KLT45581.1 hypothetical protein CC85DRAFT_299241 [Cutaneotrichosporon oleaginosum]TXT04622.1 hypothetical protein COLE_07441 [Cutaneotrichosporon oleaginosum]